MGAATGHHAEEDVQIHQQCWGEEYEGGCEDTNVQVEQRNGPSKVSSARDDYLVYGSGQYVGHVL